ncbi:catechol 1,2-dioxygenase [Halomonas halocynthiae]|uniref:catechol 1,2-dioxygenase n=1 Tax=Halomonas halocynthiae TaxID=176290 RepID=UPI00042A73E7|nr:catechol 1,2-dioxygenase [Halomonas halocynthiae]
MSVKIYDTAEVQDFLVTVSGFDKEGGDERAKQILHRLLSSVYQLIDDFDVTPEEFWGAVHLFNEIGSAKQGGLLAPGLGFDHYLDLRMDAEEAQAEVEGTTPRTIEGPLYVAGAPVSQGYTRMDDGSDMQSEVMWLTGQVRDTEGKPVAGAQVEIWHADAQGNYSFFDPSQPEYHLRCTIIADDEGRYCARSIIPSGYGVTEGSPTDQVLKLLGRHGQRPAHIHFFFSAPGYRHLTTQINLAGDPYTYDDFAYATRDELVVEGRRIEDTKDIATRDLDGPFTEVVFDVVLPATQDPELQQRHKRPRALENA